MICAWIETSSAATDFVADDERGLDRERPGDADALALAAGELVREPAPVGGSRPTRSMSVGHIVVALARV